MPYGEIAKGYELSSGETVVLTDEDFKDLPLTTSRAIDVLQFVPLEQVDPIYFEKSYYLEPDKAGVKPYALLRDALEESGKVALVKVALRNRESLATLRVRDGVFVLETMLWPDEVRTPDFGFLDETVEVRPQELAMAGSLIETLSGDFDPGQYKDSYREALQQVIEAKVAGQEVVQPEEAQPTSGTVVDLMAALRASVEAAKKGRAEDPPAPGGGGGGAPQDAGAGSGARRKPAAKKAREAAKKAAGEEGGAHEAEPRRPSPRARRRARPQDRMTRRGLPAGRRGVLAGLPRDGRRAAAPLPGAGGRDRARRRARPRVRHRQPQRRHALPRGSGRPTCAARPTRGRTRTGRGAALAGACVLVLPGGSPARLLEALQTTVVGQRVREVLDRGRPRRRVQRRRDGACPAGRCCRTAPACRSCADSGSCRACSCVPHWTGRRADWLRAAQVGHAPRHPGAGAAGGVGAAGARAPR